MPAIPVYPCSTCGIFEQTVCMSCQKAEQYTTEIGRIAQAYNATAAMYADKIARARGEIAKLNNEIERLEKRFEEAKG